MRSISERDSEFLSVFRVKRKTTMADVAIIMLLVALSVFGIIKPVISSVPGTKAEVSVDGRIEAELPLDRDIVTEFKGFDGNVKVEVKNGRVRIIESTCPCKLCVSRGWIERGRESAICLPNRVAVTVRAEEDKRELDVINH